MNIFELFGTIAIKNDAANKAITDTGSKANKLASTMKTSFDKIGKFAITCGKVVASGLAVGAAAVGSLMKSSIDEYAEYEQLIGGVETLFKDSYDKVMNYAKQAYRNQGLSANQYMSTVTSFSAALLQGLNGDTAAAAAMADIAITDMADNANKMGTEMTLIQNAYQGFAKQNYTMLDNLKLGYGGTQEEMARLINDSGVLGDAMTVTAETVNGVSFDVIIAAIHEIQTQMGITGTTAKEAAETISGSFASFKASWSNLLTGLANEEDIKPLVDDFLETGKTWLSNIGEVLPVIKANFVEAFSYIGEKVRTFWAEDVWPTVQQYAKAEFGIDLPEWSDVETTITTWWNTMKTNLQSTCTWLLKFSGFSAWTEEDTAALRNWWSGEGGVLSKIDEAIEWLLNPELPDPEATIQKITEWWNSIKSRLKLTFAVQMYTEYTGKVRDAAGDAGDALTEATGDANLGEQAETYIYNTSTWNPDSNVNMSWFADLLKNSHADGLDYVPYDDYVARLHQGEAVLTRSEASAWRSGGDTSRIESLLQEVVSYIREVASNTGAGQSIVLDSGALVGQLAPGINVQMGRMTNRKARGNA